MSSTASTGVQPPGVASRAGRGSGWPSWPRSWRPWADRCRPVPRWAPARPSRSGFRTRLGRRPKAPAEVPEERESPPDSQTRSVTLRRSAVDAAADRAAQRHLVLDQDVAAVVEEDFVVAAPRSPAVPQHQREQHAEKPDDHQDHTDGVDVDARHVGIDGEREDGANGEEEQTDTRSHSGLLRLWRTVAIARGFGGVPRNLIHSFPAV